MPHTQFSGLLILHLNEFQSDCSCFCIFKVFCFLFLLSLSSASSPSSHLNHQHFPHGGSWPLVYRDHVQLRTAPFFFMIHLQFYYMFSLVFIIAFPFLWWHHSDAKESSPHGVPSPWVQMGMCWREACPHRDELKREVLLLALKRLATGWWGAMWWKLWVPLLLRASLMKTRDLSIHNRKLNSANSLVNL